MCSQRVFSELLIHPNVNKMVSLPRKYTHTGRLLIQYMANRAEALLMAPSLLNIPPSFAVIERQPITWYMGNCSLKVVPGSHVGQGQAHGATSWWAGNSYWWTDDSYLQLTITSGLHWCKCQAIRRDLSVLQAPVIQKQKSWEGISDETLPPYMSGVLSGCVMAHTKKDHINRAFS